MIQLLKHLKIRIINTIQAIKNTLLGFVEGVQKGIDQLEQIDTTIDNIADKDYFDLLYEKLVFLTKEMEKEGAPEAFKHVLPVIKQKLQSIQEKIFYSIRW
jgi:hypothetical protein